MFYMNCLVYNCINYLVYMITAGAAIKECIEASHQAEEAAGVERLEDQDAKN